MREQKASRPAIVSIGYGTGKKKGLNFVSNSKELEKAKGKNVVVKKIGKRKKIEIARAAIKNKIKIKNFNAEKFLKKVEKSDKKTEDKTEKKK